jgi:hypothetical protein
MQRSPASNRDTDHPEPDCGADLAAARHLAARYGRETSRSQAVDSRLSRLLSDQGFITDQPPKHTHPAEAGGQPESLPGEESQRAVGQMTPAPVHAPEGETPVGETHGRPPDLPDPQT